MKSISLKNILLFFSLFNCILFQNTIDNYNITKAGIINIINSDESTIHINLNQTKETYLNYIDITLTSESDINPIIIISTNDEKCDTNRLFTSIQLRESIHIFLRREQLNSNEFYICTKKRENLDLINYNITIKNEEYVFIPYNQQGSYYVSDSSMEKMDFMFILDDQEYKTDSSISFWVKGQNIQKANMSEIFKKKVFDSGYVFYGEFQNSEKKLSIESKIGDFVTVGSTVITEGTIHELKENANEIMITSEEEICLPIKYESYLTYITGKIFTRKANAYFADENRNAVIINEEIFEKKITNGIINEFNIIHKLNESYTKGFYCLNSNTTDNLIIFSIQMTSNKEIHMVHPPLVPGEITRHFLMQNEWAVFYGMKPKEGAREVNLNLKALKGFPEMYHDDCISFPDCEYNRDSIKQLNKTYPSNMMSVYSFYVEDKPQYKEYNSITSFQPLMIVYCAEGGKNPIYEDNSFCEFETTYFTDLDKINIYEEISFSQYLLEGESDNYKLNLYGEIGDNIIYLDLIFFSGDADLNFNDLKGEANKYYLSNKIFYSIELDNNTENLEFNIKANNNCFYMVQYQIMKIGFSDEINIVESGVNYITSKYYINYDYTLFSKHIDFINYKYEQDQAYLVNFYSPNCKYEVYWVYNNLAKRISSADNYFQKILDPNDDRKYYQEIYTFFYNIISDDKSDYPNKYCIVYASGLELSNSMLSWNGRAISLSEGVPHRYTFTEKYNFIFYSYHVSDISKILVVNFNLIDKAYFQIIIYINKIELRKENIYRNGQLYIKPNEFKGKCLEKEVCTVNINVEMRNEILDKKVEVTMYQIDGTPFYLEKNVVKQDVLHGNKVKHYYFDIGNKEYGDITLDFKRGSGFIYASIQERNIKKPMANPDWRGLYHFPMAINESLKYQTYGKKIIINENDTNICTEGCYVLISIISNIKYKENYQDENIPFRISLNPRIIKKGDNLEIPKVKIDINEFIIGDIVYNRTDQIKYDYYIVTLPYDSDYVFIDWQADSPSLVINVGIERPTISKANFTFEQIKHDCVYRLNKTEILEKGNLTSNSSLKGVTLTLGIYSEINDSIQSSPYAFKLLMPLKVDKEELEPATEVIHIRSDQKVQCLPFNYHDKYICFFAVIFDDTDANNNLVLYPRNRKGSEIIIIGQSVEAESIENNNIQEISDLIKDTFENKNPIDGKYVYIENINKNQSYFFIIYAEDSSDVMEVLSSTYAYYNDMDIYPNPSTAQIFAIRDFRINLNFVTTKDLLLNIVGLSDSGAFFWGDEKEQEKKYYLEGYDDRLSLTTYTEDKDNQLTPLKVETTTLGEIQRGGFIFYITYYPRSNIDQLNKDITTEFNYRTVKMPLYYYLPINLDNSFTINFNFYDFGLKNNNNSLIYDNNLFNIWATVIPENKAINARINPGEIPKYNPSIDIKGFFDSTFGNIFLSSDDIKKIYKDTQVPNLFFCIEKDNNIKADFSSLGFELDIYSDDKIKGLNYAPEGVYISGKLSNYKEKKLIYLLHCDKKRPYFRVEYAANSDLIKFALSNNSESIENDKFNNSKTEVKSGRNLLTIKLSEDFFSSEKNNHTLYFIVFTNETNLDNKLDYFAFKYLSVKSENEFYEFLDEDKRKVTVDISGNNYKISFSPLSSIGTSYYIKAIYKDGMIQGEKMDTIAISESKGKYIQINNPTIEEDKQISYSLTIDKEISYIKVMARFNFINQKLFYLYKPEKIERKQTPETPGSKEKPDKTVLYVSIGISSFFLIIIIILIIFIFIYRNKNKDLMNQVNKISFAQGGAKEVNTVEDDLLLEKDE